MDFKLIIITAIIFAFAFAAFGIKMIFKKEKEFKKTCGSVDPTTGQKIGCTCGKAEEDRCYNKKKK